MKKSIKKIIILIPLLLGIMSINNRQKREKNVVADSEVTIDVRDEEYEIYPTPQEITYLEVAVKLSKRVNVYMESGIDIYTKNKFFEVLSIKNTKSKNVAHMESNGNYNINLGIYNSGEEVDELYQEKDLSYLEEKIDAYYLEISKTSITILGKDTDAVFYGLSTLKMIFEQSREEIHSLIIKDYSNSRYRGFIEGYYGIPWTSDERIELMRFGEIVKSNIYIYAPKDDSYHSSNWRGLYGDNDLEVLKEQIEAGLETKTKFAWAIHPFMSGSKPITESNYEEGVKDVIAKFNQVYEAGVRQFVVSADDITVPEDESTLTGYLHRDLLNDLAKWNKSKGDCGDLIFVPTSYYYINHSQRLTNYLRTLVEDLDPSVNIMWTGERICSSVANGKFQEFKEVTGREPFMWLNWPVNDYSTTHLLMGKGEVFNDNYLDREIDFSGIVANPMPEAEPSKLSIFAVCDYTWNIHKFDMNKSYVASFKYLEKNTPDSLYEICQHLSAASKYEDKYFEEGVELAKLIKNYEYALEYNDNVERRIDNLVTYFDKLIKCCNDFLNNGFNKKLIKAMRPWVEMIEDMAGATSKYLIIQKNYDHYSDEELNEILSEADSLFDRGFTHRAPVLSSNTIKMQVIDAGVVVLKPFLMSLRDGIRDDAMLRLGLPTGIVYGGFPGGINQGAIENIMDGDDETFCWFSGRPEADAFIRIDLASVQEIRDIRILAGNASGGDLMKGFVEYSLDAKSYTQIGTFKGTETIIDIRENPVEARFIRLRNNNTGNWVSIKEVSFNNLSMDAINSLTYDGFNNGIEQGILDYMIDGNEDTYCWFGRSSADAYVRWDLGELKEITSIDVLMGNDNGGDIMQGVIEYSVDGENYSIAEYLGGKARTIADLRDEPIFARYIRLRNGSKVSWIAIREIAINTLTENDPPVVSATRIITFDGFGSGIQQGSLEYIIDGDEDTFCWFGRTTADAYIRYDLKSIMQVTSIEILMGNATGGDIMHGTIEYSEDGINYTPIGELKGDARTTLDLRSTPINARYIRFKNNGRVSWVAVREITISTL